ncbi:hypothetical protein A3860_25190 [Niastella vici]|uniref:Secretion system C-terminal sorting domain-containing protein n=1 Tax=Niastella vici TaxID=1703345 RepID=A0A1V9FY39_9BACT|nr:T9SS type A sorting domain-containing protein [Niastella vici]OQP63188.1 hypothetical protein A3860_25190 [Niastella vici]
MKKITFTLTALLLCLYGSAQVGVLDGGFNNPAGHLIHPLDADNDFGQAVATHSDGRVVVASYNNNQWFTLTRYLSDGTLDASFGSGGVAKVRYDPDDNAIAYALYIYPNNTILVAGYTWNDAGGTGYDFALTRLLEDGTVDPSFGTGGWAVTAIGTGTAIDEARSLAIQADGKIVVAGFGNMGANSNDFAVVRYSSTGILETGVGAFGGGDGIVTTHINSSDKASSVAIQPADQKIVVGGTSNAGATGSNFAVVRYNTDGSLDAANFGTGGIVDLDLVNGGSGSTDDGYQLVIQPDGNILMTGMSKAVSASGSDVATIRLTTSGGLEGSFNSTGAIVNRTGSSTQAGIAIFNNNTISNTDEGARSIILQSNGDFLVAGDSDGSSPDFAFLLLRYHSDGTLDDTFDGNSNGNGVLTYDFTTTREYGYAITLYNNRIYFVGSTGSTPAGAPKNTLVAAIQYAASPLPLVLSQFYAQKQTSKAVLQWSTSSEAEVKQFVIERSNDGKTYKAIGTVAATGNSTITKNYSFADQSPLMSALNYYRLKMQDVDGNFKYSKILTIKFDGQLTANMQAYPNPVKDLLQVQLPDGLNGTVGLQIIDMQGRVVRRNNLGSDGNALNTTVDVSTLVQGIYILKAQAGNTTVITRFTKQ